MMVLMLRRTPLRDVAVKVVVSATSPILMMALLVLVVLMTMMGMMLIMMMFITIAMEVVVYSDLWTRVVVMVAMIC